MDYTGKLTGKYAEDNVGMEGSFKGKTEITKQAFKVSLFGMKSSSIFTFTRDIGKTDLTKYELAKEKLHENKLKDSDSKKELDKIIDKYNYELNIAIPKREKNVKKLKGKDKEYNDKVLSIDKRIYTKYKVLATDKRDKLEKK